MVRLFLNDESGPSVNKEKFQLKTANANFRVLQNISASEQLPDKTRVLVEMIFLQDLKEIVMMNHKPCHK